MTETIQILRKHHFRATRAIVAVYDFLTLSGIPYDAAAIYTCLQKKNIRINLTTLYRILEKFLHAGLISKVNFRDTRFLFEINSLHHHHAICEKCGKITDVKDCQMGKIEKSVSKNLSFTIRKHHLEFFGLCQKCTDL